MERVVILGAGFGGLELATELSETLGEEVDVALIDENDAFVFGYSKLDVMFGRTTLDAVRLPYRKVAKPGVRVLRETVTGIDAEQRRVTTDVATHDGAARLASILPTISGGRIVIGVCGAPFKCPPAPSECALLLHDELTARGVREACRITFVIPLATPVPPSP